MKIRPVVTGLFHAGRRTDGHDKDCSRFSQFMELACMAEDKRLWKFCISQFMELAYMAEDKRLWKFRM